MPDFAGERIHFVGVGGASMCALAEYAMLAGAEVSGSDRTPSAATERLAALGAEVYSGARRDIIARAGLVVRSSAVPLSDEEVAAALAMKKRVVERHEFLSAVAEDFRTVAAVAGTHGKTTVTAMTAHILSRLGIPFVAHIGGEPAGMGNLTVVSEKDGSLPRGIFLTEACEFGRHLLALSPDVAAVVNMECDHPDCYSGIEEVHGVFAEFVEKCPLTIVRAEDSFICKGAHIAIRENVRSATTGAPEGTARAGDAECSRMPVCTYGVSRILERPDGQTDELSLRGERARFTLPYPGAHYAADAAFAVALSVALGADFKDACAALSSFRGVKRRYERAGKLGGAEVIFDYAHHPTELACTLKAAESGNARVLAVFQPHTYSRTAKYMDDFVRVLGGREEVVLMPVYAARERGAQGASSVDLARAIENDFPECDVYLAVSHDDALNRAAERAVDYDKVLFLGAGDIYDIKSKLAGLTTPSPHSGSG